MTVWSGTPIACAVCPARLSESKIDRRKVEVKNLKVLEFLMANEAGQHCIRHCTRCHDEMDYSICNLKWGIIIVECYETNA
jgi:hypothetical protein